MDFNTVIAPVGNRTNLEILQFDASQGLLRRKRYLVTQKRDTDTIPQIEDIVVSDDSTIYITGSRLKKTWLLSDKQTAFNSTATVVSLQARSSITGVFQDFNSTQVVVEVNSTDNQELTLGFYNNLGRMVKSIKTHVVKGDNYIPVDLGGANKGLHIVHLNNTTYPSSYKFVKM